MFSSATIEAERARTGSEATAIDLDALASRRSGAALGRTLPGRCRGTVLARWADLCRRHFGEPALRRIRDGIDAWSPGLPEAPGDDAWFPVGVQIELTDAVIDGCLGGDPRPLEAMLADDVRASIGRASALLLRSVGPGPVLGRARQIHAHLYDVGQARAQVRSGTAVIDCEGAQLFAHPTWQLLQLFAHRGLVALTGRALRSLHASMPGPDAFRVELAWA